MQGKSQTLKEGKKNKKTGMGITAQWSRKRSKNKNTTAIEINVKRRGRSKQTIWLQRNSGEDLEPKRDLQCH